MVCGNRYKLGVHLTILQSYSTSTFRSKLSCAQKSKRVVQSVKLTEHCVASPTVCLTNTQMHTSQHTHLHVMTQRWVIIITHLPNMEHHTPSAITLHPCYSSTPYPYYCNYSANTIITLLHTQYINKENKS